MTHLPIEYLKEHKCSETNCYNLGARGYTLCEGHLYGFPRKMDEADIARLKEEMKKEQKEELIKATERYWDAVRHPEKYQLLRDKFEHEEGVYSDSFTGEKEKIMDEINWRLFCFKTFLGEQKK